MSDREPYTFDDYHQRIHEAVCDMVRQANEDMGGEVIDPVGCLTLSQGADHDKIMEREVGFIIL